MARVEGLVDSLLYLFGDRRRRLVFVFLFLVAFHFILVRIVLCSGEEPDTAASILRVLIVCFLKLLPIVFHPRYLPIVWHPSYVGVIRRIVVIVIIVVRVS